MGNVLGKVKGWRCLSGNNNSHIRISCYAKGNRKHIVSTKGEGKDNTRHTLGDRRPLRSGLDGRSSLFCRLIINGWKRQAGYLLPSPRKLGRTEKRLSSKLNILSRLSKKQEKEAFCLSSNSLDYDHQQLSIS